MLTVEALCSQMKASGRPLSQRAARDWCSKGLLPHLPRHGLGRGRGSEAFWSDPRVFEQARIAYDLLARYSRADFARLSLWLLGFKIELRDVRTAYRKSIERHLHLMLAHRGKQPDENVGRLATMFGRQFANQTAAPADAQEAITGLAEEFLQVYYGTDSEFVGEGLAELWQKAAPLVGTSSTSGGLADFKPGDEDLMAWAYYLRRFVSLPAQREMVESASDYELMRARRLMRCAIGCFRRFDPSVDCRDDIESVGGWFVIVFGRPAVPILIALLRQDTIRHEIMAWLLDAAQRLPHKVKRPAPA
jgi:hypothetical protein